MIYQGIELHNVDGLQSVGDAVALLRTPQAIMDQVERHEVLKSPANVELRFVVEPDAEVSLTVSSAGVTQLSEFWGSFLTREQHLIGEEPTTLTLRMPERIARMDAQSSSGLPFNKHVARLMASGAQLRVHDIHGPESLRPPHADELPSLRYLSYGTSITQGALATKPYLSYAALTARKLGADHLNLAMSGACLVENGMADYLAARDDWDLATFELSVNMLNSGFTTETFRERVTYLLDVVTKAHPKKPIFCITLLPLNREVMPALDFPPINATADEYRQALRDIVSELGHDNVHLIEGPQVLTSFDGLTEDLIHPSDLGHIEIAKNLARMIQSKAPRLTNALQNHMP